MVLVRPVSIDYAGMFLGYELAFENNANILGGISQNLKEGVEFFDKILQKCGFTHTALSVSNDSV